MTQVLRICTTSGEERFASCLEVNLPVNNRDRSFLRPSTIQLKNTFEGTVSAAKRYHLVGVRVDTAQDWCFIIRSNMTYCDVQSYV